MEKTIVLINLVHDTIEVISTPYNYEIGDCISPLELASKYPKINENRHMVALVSSSSIDDIKKGIESRAKKAGKITQLTWLH